MKKFFRIVSLSLLVIITTTACSDNKVIDSNKKAKEEAQQLIKDYENKGTLTNSKNKLNTQNQQKQQQQQQKKVVKTLPEQLEEEKAIRQEEAKQGVTVSNNKDYDYYYDQRLSGKHHVLNCVPTCTAMILKYLDPNSKDTSESLRNEYEIDGKGWNPDIFLDVLKKRNIKYIAFPHKNAEQTDMMVRRYIKNGYIAMFFSDMHKIYGVRNNPSKLGKSHNDPEVVRHTYIVKGYKYVDNELYYEIYDPDSGNIKDKSGQPIGKNRYYKASEVISSIIWPNVLFFK